MFLEMGRRDSTIFRLGKVPLLPYIDNEQGKKVHGLNKMHVYTRAGTSCTPAQEVHSIPNSRRSGQLEQYKR